MIWILTSLSSILKMIFCCVPAMLPTTGNCITQVAQIGHLRLTWENMNLDGGLADLDDDHIAEGSDSMNSIQMVTGWWIGSKSRTMRKMAVEVIHP